MATDRAFKVGETVHLRARVSKPGTREPQDATVTLASLKRATATVAVSAAAFTRVGEGDYTLVLATEGFAAGTYDVVVRVADGTSAVSLLTDRFVLTPL